MMNANEPGTMDRQPRTGRGWLGGLILIVIGIVFLVQQSGTFTLHNWWAAFILIPAFGSFATAYALARRAGGFSQAARGNLFGGLLVLTVAAIFLVDLSWAVYWPVFVILAGLSLLFAGLPLGTVGDHQPHVMRLFAGPWLVSLGLAAVLLGAGFLLRNLGRYDPAALLGPRWWSLALLLTAFGGLIATVRLLVAPKRLRLAISSNLLGVLIVAGVGLVAFLGLDWNLLWPITMIATGCVLVLGMWSQDPKLTP